MTEFERGRYAGILEAIKELNLTESKLRGAKGTLNHRLAVEALNRLLKQVAKDGKPD